MKTVLITGASSGIGRETARLFQAEGWNVAATMRIPEAEKEFTQLPNVKVLRCDVTDPHSIDTAIAEAASAFEHIDVLVNNAGYYLFGPLETADHEQIRRQLDTNLLGLIDFTRRIIPHFRTQGSGTIINVSSIAGQISIPLQSMYCAAKWGVEGFSEALQFELRPFGIHVKIIEPGVIRTDFLGRSMEQTQDGRTSAYNGYFDRVFGNIVKNGEKGSSPEGVAKTIYRAATDGSQRLRYATGASKNMIAIHRMLPTSLYNTMVSAAMEK